MPLSSIRRSARSLASSELERLVHQVDRRVAHQRPADRDPLHLAARERGRLVVELVGDPQHLGDGSATLRGDLVGRRRAGSASAAGRRGSRAPSCAGRANTAGTPSRRCAAPGVRPAIGRPPMKTSPLSGWSRPEIMRSVVVLPAPVGPSSTTKAPSGTVMRHGVERGDGAEGLADAGEDDLSHGASTPSLAAERERAARSRPSKSESVRASKARPAAAPTATGSPEATRALTRAVRRCRASRSGWCRDIRSPPPRRGRAPRRRGGRARAGRRAPARPRAPSRRSRDGDLGLAERGRWRRPGRRSPSKRQEVHRRRADEVGDEHRRRPVVDLLRPAELLDDAVVHHDDLVAHLHRLELVVGDVDRGRAHPVVQRAQLARPCARGTRRRARRAARPSGSTWARARWRGRARRAGGRRRRGRRRGGRGCGSMPRMRATSSTLARTSARGMPWLTSG